MKGKFRVLRNTSKKNIKRFDNNIKKIKKHKVRIEKTQIGEVVTEYTFDNKKLIDFKRENIFWGRIEM